MSNDVIANLTRRYRMLAGQIAGMQEEQDSIKSQILAMVKPGFKRTVDDVSVSVSEPRRSFSEQRAVELIGAIDPAALIETVEWVRNPKKVREVALRLGVADDAMLPGTGSPIIKFS